MAKVDISWNPFDKTDPGPCIQVIVTNSQEYLDAGRASGLEFPAPLPIRALIDTGASVTVISKTFADYLKLFQTSTGREIRALGGTLRCGEHAGAISFPGTGLRSFNTIPIISAEFVKERNYACLIGRDLIRNWRIQFDGRANTFSIED